MVIKKSFISVLLWQCASINKKKIVKNFLRFEYQMNENTYTLNKISSACHNTFALIISLFVVVDSFCDKLKILFDISFIQNSRLPLSILRFRYDPIPRSKCPGR